MTEPVEAPLEEWQQRWHRLPLVALIFFFLKSVHQLAKQLYQAIPALAGVFIFARDFRDAWPWFAVGILVVFVLAVVLQYLRFTYQVNDQRVQMKQGVFKRTELALDYERIQQADLQIPWYLRWVGRYVVRLESAGAKGQEVILVGLTQPQAELLQQRVQLRGNQATSPQTHTNANSVAQPNTEEGAADFSFTIGKNEVWKIGLIQNPFIAVGLVLAFLVSNERIRNASESALVGFVERFPSKTLALVVLVGGAFLLMALFIAAAIGFAWNKYYGYQLTRNDQRYSYRAGFASPLQRSFSLRKLQTIKIKQGIIARLMHRVTIELAQAGGMAQRQERFLIPILTEQQRQRFVADLGVPSSETTWHRSHKWWISHWLLITFVVPTLIFDWRVGVGATVLVFVLRVLSWRKRGWLINEQWFATRSGVFGFTERWLPISKMQSISWAQGPLQRRLNIASVVVCSAAGHFYVVDIPVQQARQLQQRIIQETASCRRLWM
ncbi:PH domain-containing protein [Aliidiomarina celeris]|uniref:PH domain-containing protein n=1 Tax=Aliidiomarina celeris TaxID=2249428 RepID=UPI0018E648CF|nr:PH domain-containing protein [Aliidiomarina celeris]